MNFALSLRKKIIISCIVLALVPLLVLGAFTYQYASEGVYAEVKDKLSTQVTFYRDLLSQNIKDAEESSKTAEDNAKMIVAQQSELLIKMIQRLNKKDIEKLKDELAKFKVGKTGYIAVLDYEGNYIVSKDRKADGVNIRNAKDADGSSLAKLIIKYILGKTQKKNSQEKRLPPSFISQN